jgi:GntR family transcriptional regulator
MHQMEILDKSSPIPLYFQLAEKIRNKIENNEWPVDCLIPSELKLCDTYQISRGTVRQAINDLIQEGYLYRKHGLGTFACKPGTVWPVSNFYCTEFLNENQNIKLKRQILSKKVIVPNEELKRIMKLKGNQELYRIEGLVTNNYFPISLEISYLLKYLFPNLKSKDLSTMAPYEVFIRRYELKISKVRESFSTIILNQETSKKLKLLDKTCALLVNRFAWSNNIIFEYRESIIRTDKCHYTIELL